MCKLESSGVYTIVLSLFFTLIDCGYFSLYQTCPSFYNTVLNIAKKGIDWFPSSDKLR